MPSTRHRRVQYSQNFLHSKRLVASLVERSSLCDRDLVIEIGPGKGILTDALSARARHVLAIEKDPHHAGIARSRFGSRSNVTVFECDFLTFPLPATPYKVFANTPYRHTAAIVGRLTSGIAPPEDAYLTMQAEAAERFIGGTMVSASIWPWFAPMIVHRFRRRDFVPQPAVESVLLRIERRAEPALPRESCERYRQMVEALYSAWRPTVEDALMALGAKAALKGVRATMGSSLRVRPSAMEADQWVRLFIALERVDDDRIWQAMVRASKSLRQQQRGLERPDRTRTRGRPRS